MSDNVNTHTYNLGPDDKAALVMIYTPQNLYWGDVIVKQMVRVSTWLRTNTAPNSVRLLNAKSMLSTTTAPLKPMAFDEVHIFTSEIVAFHLMPPAMDPVDYDTREPNRKMEPITAMVGPFRMDGLLRMSTMANLDKYVEVTREPFTGVYDVEITNPYMPAFKMLKVPYVLISQSKAAYATRPKTAA